MAKITDGDRKILNMAWSCFKAVPEVDYKKLADLGNYKTAASATSCYLSAKKKVVASSGTNTPTKTTEGDKRILALAWQCFKITPQVDYKKLQEMGGYKTSASATSCYLAARKKVLNPVATPTTTPTGKTATPTGRKRKTAAVAEDALPKDSPVKKTKKEDTSVIKEEKSEEDGKEDGEAGRDEEESEDATKEAVMPSIEKTESGGLEALFNGAKQYLYQEETTITTPTDSVADGKIVKEDHEDGEVKGNGIEKVEDV